MNDTMLRALGVCLALGVGCGSPSTSATTTTDDDPTDIDASSSSTDGMPIGTESTTSSSETASGERSSSGESSSSESGDESSESGSTGAIVPDCAGVPEPLLAQGMIGVNGSFSGMQSWIADAPGESCESADDFVVPESTCWCITSVVVATMLTTAPMPEVQLDLYDDEAGLPAVAPWFSEQLTPTMVEDVEELPGTRMHTLELSAPAIARSGRHWLAPKGMVGTDGIYGLAISLEDHDNESTKIRWGEAVAPHCTAWDDVYVCTRSVPHEIELAFELHGVAVDCE